MHTWSMKSNLTVPYIVVLHQGVEHRLLNEHTTIVLSSHLHFNHLNAYCLEAHCPPKLHGFMLQQLIPAVYY